MSLVEVKDVALDASAPGRLREALRAAQCDAVVGVLPSSLLVLRETTVSVAPEDDPRDVVVLQCEAHLPETIPAHRRVGGLLMSPDGSARAMMLGWPEQRDKDENSLCAALGEEALYTGEIAALTMLLGADHADDAALYADGEAGTVALSLGGEHHRAARAASRPDQAWFASVERFVIESALAAGLPEDRAARWGETAAIACARRTHALYLPGDAAERHAEVTGRPKDDTWWDAYGIAIGAVLGAASEEPALRGLFQLRAAPVDATPTVATRTLSLFATPRRAAVAVIVCLLLWAIIPLTTAAIRTAVLHARVGDLATFQERHGALRKRLALHTELADQRWPMSKLLADVSGAAPPGIELDDLTLSHGQQLQLSGFAGSLDEVIDFQNNLQRTRIFEEVQLPRRDVGETGKVEFTLRANVVHPYIVTDAAFDYAESSLADRLYGPGSTAGPDEGEDANAAATTRDDGGSTSQLAQPRAVRDAEPAQAPTPITIEDVKAMDDEALRKAFIKWATEKSRRAYDDQTRQRLADEFEMIKAERARRTG